MLTARSTPTFPFPALRRARVPLKTVWFSERQLGKDSFLVSLDELGEGAAPVHAHPPRVHVHPVASEHP